MLRKQLINKSTKDKFIWRSREVFRIEAFSDAVFAFSITLLIVSLEVPETFDELIHAINGFFAFAVGFALLFQIWYSQFKYFRRYGLQDLHCTILNGILLFVVLFYMYPLKFLFTLLLSPDHETDKVIITQEQIPSLMVIYGVGYIAVHLIFILLYRHALKQKGELNLNDYEVFETKSKIYSYLILASIGLISIIFACILEPRYSGFSGFVYILIGPALSVFYSRRAKAGEKLLQSIKL